MSSRANYALSEPDYIDSPEPTEEQVMEAVEIIAHADPRRLGEMLEEAEEGDLQIYAEALMAGQPCPKFLAEFRIKHAVVIMEKAQELADDELRNGDDE